MPPKRASGAAGNVEGAGGAPSPSPKPTRGERFAAVSELGDPYTLTEGLPLKVEVLMKLRRADGLAFKCTDAAYSEAPGPNPSEVHVLFEGGLANEFARVSRKDVLLLRAFAVEEAPADERPPPTSSGHPMRVVVRRGASVAVLRGPHRAPVDPSELRKPREEPLAAAAAEPPAAKRPRPAAALSFGPSASSSSASSSSSSSVPFARLADVRAGSQHNVYGVVIDSVLPYKTGGSDYNARIVIADESCREGVQVTFFAGNSAQLPAPSQVGEVFRGLRIQFETFRNKTCGKAFLKGPSKPSWAIIPGLHGDPIAPVTWEPSCQLSPDDESRIKALREFALTFVTTSLLPGSAFRKRLEDAAMSSADVLCKVASAPADAGGWTEVGLCDDPLAGPKRVLSARLPHGCGATPPLRAAFASLKVGDWVLLKLVSSIGGPAPHLLLERKSSILRVPPIALDVTEARRALPAPAAVAAPASAAPAPAPAPPHVVTTTLHDDVPLHTLRDVLGSDLIPWKWRCRARVSGVAPAAVEEFCLQRCVRCRKWLEAPAAAGGCCPGAPFEWFYAAELLLQDGPARLRAILAEGDGTDFFGGVPPTNLRESNVSRDILRGHIGRLTAAGAVVEVCLKSYRVPVPEGGTAVRYRVFDTHVGPPAPYT